MGGAREPGLPWNSCGGGRYGSSTRLPQEYKAIRSPGRYRVDHSDALTTLADRVAGSRRSNLEA